MLQFTNAIKRFNNLILEELKNNGVNCWIAGGSVRDYFSSVYKISDFDLFFPNENEYEKTKNYLNNNNGIIKFENNNGLKILYKDNTFDLIKKFFQNPEDTINAFDFTVSMFAIDGKKAYYGESSFVDLSKKQLIINKITYPASTLFRAFKYYKKGYSICPDELRKIIESIQNMPINNNITNINNSNNNIENNKNEEEISGDLLANNFFGGID